VPLDQEAVGLEGSRPVAIGPGPWRGKRRLRLQLDDGLHREDPQRGRKQTEVAEVIVRTVAHAAAIVGKGEVEMAGALRAVAVADLVRGAARVGAVVGTQRRERITIGKTSGRTMVITVVMVVVEGADMTVVVTMMVEPDRLGMDMRAAAGLKRDADRVPWRHADHHLRKQEERKHEAEHGAAHGAGEEYEMYRPIRALGQGGYSLSS
jgi:hypothetical protein